MNCPSCSMEMTSMTLDSHAGAPVVIDVCAGCQVFWFDRHESLKLSPASTLHLMQFIGERTAAGLPVAEALRCPRCAAPLRLTNDMQRNTRFRYWRCPQEHGRLIRFFDFLREKNFIRVLSPAEMAELRRNVSLVNCSSCGAPVDLRTASACDHCRAPISMLDMKQPERMLAQLRQAAEGRPVDPDLPLKLARAKRDIETSLGPDGTGNEWWRDAPSAGLVQAGLAAVARWLRKSGV